MMMRISTTHSSHSSAQLDSAHVHRASTLDECTCLLVVQYTYFLFVNAMNNWLVPVGVDANDRYAY